MWPQLVSEVNTFVFGIQVRAILKINNALLQNKTQVMSLCDVRVAQHLTGYYLEVRWT